MTTAESNAPRSRLIRYPPAGTPTPAEQNQNPSVAESPYTFPCLRAAATHRRKVVHFAPTMLDTSPLLANQKGKFPSPNTAERSLSPRPATFGKEILNLEQRLPSGRKRRPIRSIQTARTLSPSTRGSLGKCSHPPARSCNTCWPLRSRRAPHCSFALGKAIASVGSSESGSRAPHMLQQFPRIRQCCNCPPGCIRTPGRPAPGHSRYTRREKRQCC